jgi:hypothetical protein
MKYCFTTLAVGEPYESRTMEFYKNMRELTTNCDFFITTCNTDFPEMGDRIYTNFINPPSLHYTQGGFSFHVNLKCLSLKHVITHEKQMLKENPDFQKYDYIIFTDGDWLIANDFSEEKIISMLNHIEESGGDFAFERPSPIGEGRINPKNGCFFAEKFDFYDCWEYEKWDDGQVVNEQFLVFKNGPKYRFFTQRWEQFLWYCIMNDIRSYPDGFEIGISALEADMVHMHSFFHNHIPNCFGFYTKSDVYHSKF